MHLASDGMPVDGSASKTTKSLVVDALDGTYSF